MTKEQTNNWEKEMENDDWLYDPETLSPMYGQSEVHYNANLQKIKDFIISKVIPQEREKWEAEKREENEDMRRDRDY